MSIQETEMHAMEPFKENTKNSKHCPTLPAVQLAFYSICAVGMNGARCLGRESSSQRRAYRVLAVLYCMAALDTWMNETKDQLDESLQADYLCFSSAAWETQLDGAPAFLRLLSLHLASCPSDRWNTSHVLCPAKQRHHVYDFRSWRHVGHLFRGVSDQTH